MRDRRLSARYDVSQCANLKASTKAGPKDERLLTMSRGGCGFCTTESELKIKAGQRIVCEFNFFPAPAPAIEVVGEVLYVHPHPFENTVGKFYGIKFLESEAHKVQTLLAYVEAQSLLGKVALM